MVGPCCEPSGILFPQSISESDWLNTIAAGDITGELVAAVLPDLSLCPLNVRRTSDRRFVRDCHVQQGLSVTCLGLGRVGVGFLGQWKCPDLASCMYVSSSSCPGRGCMGS